jgi:hypothetical protein
MTSKDKMKAKTGSFCIQPHDVRLKDKMKQENELKTLKDIDFTGNGYWTFVHLTKLKEQAIKWYHRSDDNKHKFIRDFFNLKEEDLK